MDGVCRWEVSTSAVGDFMQMLCICMCVVTVKWVTRSSLLLWNLVKWWWWACVESRCAWTVVNDRMVISSARERVANGHVQLQSPSTAKLPVPVVATARVYNENRW